MSEKLSKNRLIDDPKFVQEYAKKYPHLLDEHGNITISIGGGISTSPKLMVSTAMPTLEFPENKLSPIKSLRVTIGTYEDTSEELFHYLHNKIKD